MVRLSQAASVLLLALGASAFVPAKLGNVGVRSSVTNSPANNQIESCDAVLSRMDGKVSGFNSTFVFCVYVYVQCAYEVMFWKSASNQCFYSIMFMLS